MNRAAKVKQIESEIQFKSRCLQVLNDIPEHPAIESIATFSGWMTIYTSADWSVYRQLRRALGPSFRREGRLLRTEDCLGMIVPLRHVTTSVPVNIYMSVDDTTTCRRIQVGSKSVPVYEIHSA